MNYQLLSQNITTLKAASRDSAHDEYMTESELHVVNFDRVKTRYLNELRCSEEMASSVDALAKGEDGTLYMIEFKNGDCKPEGDKIRLKIKDSLLILCDICHKRLDDARKNVVFVLVVNPSRTNLTFQDRMAIAMANKSGKTSVFCGLDKIAGVFVRKVLIFDKENFSGKLIPNLTHYA